MVFGSVSDFKPSCNMHNNLQMEEFTLRVLKDFISHNFDLNTICASSNLKSNEVRNKSLTKYEPQSSTEVHTLSFKYDFSILGAGWFGH